MIEQATRVRVRAENLLHRAVFVVVRSSGGDVLVHRRAETKDLWPGYWDIAVGGVVDAGEDYAGAAVRELAEELGIEAPLTEIGSGRFDGAEVAHLNRTYLAVHDGPFHFSDDEVVEARFVTVAELPAFASSHPICPDSVVITGPFVGLG